MQRGERSRGSAPRSCADVPVSRCVALRAEVAARPGGVSSYGGGNGSPPQPPAGFAPGPNEPGRDGAGGVWTQRRYCATGRSAHPRRPGARRGGGRAPEGGWVTTERARGHRHTSYRPRRQTPPRRPATGPPGPLPAPCSSPVRTGRAQAFEAGRSSAQRRTTRGGQRTEGAAVGVATARRRSPPAVREHARPGAASSSRARARRTPHARRRRSGRRWRGRASEGHNVQARPPAGGRGRTAGVGRARGVARNSPPRTVDAGPIGRGIVALLRRVRNGHAGSLASASDAATGVERLAYVLAWRARGGRVEACGVLGSVCAQAWCCAGAG